MKRFLALAFALAFAVVAHAAPGKGTGLSSPVMTNFNARDFLVTLAAGTAPTNIIQLKWGIPNPPAPDLPGNITYFVGGTNLWTNLGGILQPKNLTLPVMITNQLQFGPGTTNVVKRTNGIDVVYVNGGTVSTYPGWGVINTGDNSEAYFKAGGNLAAIYGRSGVSLIDGLSSGNDIRWFNNRLWLMQANAIFGGDTNTTPFFPVGQIHVSTNFIRGFLDSTDTNFSWTVMYQPDTNSPMIFDQVTSGTAGVSRGFEFRTNNGVALKIAANSGYTGIGTNYLKDDGTFGPVTAASTNSANWTALGSTNSTLTGDAFVNSLLPTNGLQSVAGAAATYIGTADIWNMGVNSSAASAIYNNCYSFYNFGTNSAHGIKATNSYSIWNFGLDGLEDSVLNNARNVFNFGADPGWQSQYTDSYNIMNLGFAAGESTLYSGTTHDIVNIGQGAGHAATLANSGNFYMIGNEPGDNIQASGANDVYAFGSGLKNAVLGATKRLFAIGGTAGNSINGAYTNVVLIGDGATIGATGENQIIAGPTMTMSVAGTTTIAPTLLQTPDLLTGGMSVYRGTLTHAGGNVIVDFSPTNRYWSCTITGAVTFVLTNAAAGKWANILLYNTQATNCTPTFNFPVGSKTNWFGGAPSTLTAGTVGSLAYYPTSTDTNAVLAAYTETQ